MSLATTNVQSRCVVYFRNSQRVSSESTLLRLLTDETKSEETNGTYKRERHGDLSFLRGSDIPRGRVREDKTATGIE